MQDVLVIAVADNSGQVYKVQQPVDSLTYELVVGLYREVKALEKTGHIIQDMLEVELFGEVITR